MITLSGNLSIREISGKHGVFRVGKLQCELGEFAIKSSLIEEFDQGTYRGQFGISRIYPTTYAVGNRITCEVRAELSNLLLDTIDQALPDDVPNERDPIEEETGLTVTPQSAPDATTTPVEASASDSVTTTAEKLFGLVWPLGNVVKLDPTVGRALLREQVAYLKANHYRYQPRVTHWLLNESA